MSKLFRKNGLDIGHEEMGKDGTSDWQYAIPNEKAFPWGCGVREDYRFDVVIHNIRDPLTAIPSISNTETPGYGVDDPSVCNKQNPWIKKSEEFRRKFVYLPDKNIFDNAALSYLGWNDIVKQSLSYFSLEGAHIRVVRIEHALQDLRGLGIKKPLNKKVNSRKHNGIGAKQWSEISAANLNKLEDFCAEYGYEPITGRLDDNATQL